MKLRSDEVKDLILNMLNIDSERRFTAKQCLDHSWFYMDEDDFINPELCVSTLKAIKNFKVKIDQVTNLQRIVLQFINNQHTLDEEEEDLRKTFNDIDKDHNGKLSKEEIFTAYAQIYGDEEAHRLVQETFENIDSNNNNEIDYNEFLMSTLKIKKLVKEEELIKAFNALDEVILYRIKMDKLRWKN